MLQLGTPCLGNISAAFTVSTRKLTRRVVDREIEKAFAIWSNVTDLTFTNRHYGPVHIELSFEKR